jgi:hypothetical protein
MGSPVQAGLGEIGQPGRQDVMKLIQRTIILVTAAGVLAAGVPGVAGTGPVWAIQLVPCHPTRNTPAWRGFLLVESRLHHGREVLLPQALQAGARAGRVVGRRPMVYPDFAAAGGNLELVPDRDLVRIGE